MGGGVAPGLEAVDLRGAIAIGRPQREDIGKGHLIARKLDGCSAVAGREVRSDRFTRARRQISGRER